MEVGPKKRWGPNYKDDVDRFVERRGELQISQSGSYVFRVGENYTQDYIEHIGDD